MIKLGSAVVVDGLKLCFTAGEEKMKTLANIKRQSQRLVPGVTLLRTTNRYYPHSFDVCAGDIKIATLNIGHFANKQDKYVFYRIENNVLYDPELFKYTLSVPQRMGLDFNNFSLLDLALDLKFNIASLIKRLMRREDIKTIINGKAIKNRDETLKIVRLDYSTSLKRIKDPSIYIKQQKAVRDKTKGVVVTAYNKTAEISTSGKHYIESIYGYPLRIYRLEVHLNNREVKDYCRSFRVVEDESLLLDQEILKDLFFYHLSSVIRFTKNRKPIKWPELLDSKGRIL